MSVICDFSIGAFNLLIILTLEGICDQSLSLVRQIKCLNTLLHMHAVSQTVCPEWNCGVGTLEQHEPKAIPKMDNS